MVLKLPIKKSVSSNKDHTLPENPELAKSASGSLIPSLTPFIDKIVITLTPPTEELRAKICAAIFTVADDTTLLLGVKRARGFDLGKRIVLGCGFDAKSNPYLMIAYHKSQVFKLRLEFSPADLGVEGMNVLHAALSVFLPDGWDFVVENGVVTKIEVSVDLPKVKTSDLHFIPKQTTSAQTWSHGGLLQTLVLGKAKSGNQTRIYDRGAKRKAKGQFSPAYEGTRVERIFKLAKPLKGLAALPNPFKDFSFSLAPQRPPGELRAYIWTMFMDSVTARSLPVALKLLPEEKRTMYRKWLQQNAVEWWNPDTIWAAWPAYLVESKILSK
jgi:hypothetical protein